MISNPKVERGRLGRVAYARIAPNEDLVTAMEKICLAEGFRHAFVRGGLGSLVDGCLEGREGRQTHVAGVVEVVSLSGEVRTQPDGSIAAMLTGVIGDMEGKVYGGKFVAGANPVCMTFEVALEEWLPD